MGSPWGVVHGGQCFIHHRNWDNRAKVRKTGIYNSQIPTRTLMALFLRHWFYIQTVGTYIPEELIQFDEQDPS